MILDSFDRTYLNPPPPWSVWNGGSGGPRIVEGDLGLTSGSTSPFSSFGGLSYVGEVFSPDQYSQATLSATYVLIGETTPVVQVFVRRRLSDKQRYAFMFYNGLWRIKLDGGPDAPYLASVAGPKPQPWDQLRIEALGTLLKGYLNGALLLEATDTVIADGAPGMVLGSWDLSAYPIRFVAEWRGGSL